MEGVREIKLDNNVVVGHIFSVPPGGEHYSFAASRHPDAKFNQAKEVGEFGNGVSIGALGCKASPSVAYCYRSYSTGLLLQTR